MTWEIDVDAGSHVEAAKNALAIQRDPTSIADIFDVTEHDKAETARVDLAAERKAEKHHAKCPNCGSHRTAVNDLEGWGGCSTCGHKGNAVDFDDPA